MWQLGELSNGEIGFYPVARSQLVKPRPKLKYGQLAPLHAFSHKGAFFEREVYDRKQDPPEKIECKRFNFISRRKISFSESLETKSGMEN